eukprot:5624241-Pleurochrysis_carterae.AAC.1
MQERGGALHVVHEDLDLCVLFFAGVSLSMPQQVLGEHGVAHALGVRHLLCDEGCRQPHAA